MSIVPCPACNREISADAVACPHCGHPLRAIERAKATKKAIGGCLFVLAIAASVISWMIYYGGELMEEEAKHPTCISDYTKCKDNEEIVSNHKSRRHTHLQDECKSAAKALSKYGEPELPLFPFKDYWSGHTFIEAGGATLLEDGGIFPNANGGKMRVGLSCHYDLRSDIATVGFTP